MGFESPPDPPDYGPIAEVQGELGQKYFKLAQQQFRWSKRKGNELSKLTRKVTNQALQIQAEQADVAREAQDRYDSIFKPLEDEFIAEAQAFDTGERRAAESGEAIADVGMAFDAERASAERRLAAFGVDPSSLRGAALDRGMGIAEATAKAAAGTAAGRRVEDVGRALRADAINLGRGVPSQVAQSYSTSLGAGGQAAGAGAGSLSAQTDARTSGAVYGGLANQSIAGQASTLTQGYNAQLAAYQSSPLQTILGGVAGAGSAFALNGFSFADGGEVDPALSPSGGAIPDDVPANLTAGEFVIPQEVVAWKGQEFFHNLAKKSKEAMAGIPMGAPAGGPPQQGGIPA